MVAEEAVAKVAPSTDAKDEAQVIGPGNVTLELVVDGKRIKMVVEPRTTLLDALRDRAGVTSPKKVCDRATCGACTVLEDGALIYSCTRLALEAESREIVTVGGLGTPESMHPVQQAFVEQDAQQCGFCTPGFVLASAVLLDEHPDPSSLSQEELARAMGGNLCRCGTYVGIQKVLSIVPEVADAPGEEA